MRAIIAAAVLLAGTPVAAAMRPVEERDLRQAMGFAQRGLAALQKGNVARAREDFERATSKFSNLPDAHAGFGHLAMRERRFEDALREYKLAEQGGKEMGILLIQLESERFARSRDELMRLRGMQMELAQAAARSEARSALGSSSGGGSDAGRIQGQLMQVESRIRNLEQMTLPTHGASRTTPPDLLFFQGNALFDLKRTADAIAVWETAAKQLKEFGPVHNNLAVAYWMSGRIDEAWASLRRAEGAGFKVNPSFRADLEKAGPATAADAGRPAPSAGSHPR